ncbi:MAG: hypothetical protein R3C45_20740 [Phycisphaerales bacterium]
MLFPNYVVMEEGVRSAWPCSTPPTHAVMGILRVKAIARTKVERHEDRPYDKCWYAPEDRPDVAHLMLRYTLNLRRSPPPSPGRSGPV